MAAAMARGWADAEHGPEAMLFCDAGSAGRPSSPTSTGGEAVDSLAELAEVSDAVVLAVKPAALEAAARQLGGQGDAIASVLAATPVGAPARGLPGRPGGAGDAEPAAEVQRGVICHAPLESADGEVGARLLNLLGELSHLVEVPDELMDAAMAVMACSPAYLALVVAGLAEAGAARASTPS